MPRHESGVGVDKGAAAVSALQALLEAAATALTAQKQAKEAAAQAGTDGASGGVSGEDGKLAEGNAAAALEALRVLLDAATAGPRAETGKGSMTWTGAGAQEGQRHKGAWDAHSAYEQTSMGPRGAAAGASPTAAARAVQRPPPPPPPAAAAAGAAAGLLEVHEYLLQGIGTPGGYVEPPPPLPTPLSVHAYEEMQELLQHLDSLHTKLMWLDVCAGFFVAGCLTWEQHARYVLGSWPHAGSLIPFARKLAGLKAASKMLGSYGRPGRA
jgi:hypothetical protein